MDSRKEKTPVYTLGAHKSAVTGKSLYSSQFVSEDEIRQNNKIPIVLPLIFITFRSRAGLTITSPPWLLVLADTPQPHVSNRISF